MVIDSASASAIAASLSAIATFFAAYATWKAPFSAAKYAEQLRNALDTENERTRLKRAIFFILMQERASIYSTESVKALNSIDVVFCDVPKVREAWAGVHFSLDSNNSVPQHAKDEKMRNLLREMAADLGISNELRLDDFARIYYPTALAEEEHIRFLQRKAALNHFTSQAELAANTATPQPNLFPPKPD